MALDDPVAAADRFAALLERFPHGEYGRQAALLLAQCRHRAGAPGEAQRAYERVLSDEASPYVPDAMYGLALALFQQGEVEPAGARLDDMLKRYADHELADRARFLRGRVWFERGDFARAETLFEQVAAAAGEDQDDAAYWLGKSALRRGDAKQAATRFAEAARAHPESALMPEMIYDRAVAQTRDEDHEGAIGTLRDFATAYAGHALVPDALYLAATAGHRIGDYAGSSAICRGFATEHAGHALASAVAFLAAENDFLRGDHAAAAGAFTDYLDAYPDGEQRDDARYRLGMSLYHLDRYDDASSVLVEIATEPSAGIDFPLALYALGDINFQREDWAAAERELRRYAATGDVGALDDATLKVGLAELRQDDAASALAAFDELIERSPNGFHHTQALFERGQALVTLGRPDEAKRAFEAVLAAEGGDTRFAPYALNHLGALAHSRGDYEGAAAHFARAAAEAPGFDDTLAAEATFARGRALMAAERYADAADAFARVVAAHPQWSSTPEAAALHAVSQARQGIHEAALEAINRVERRYVDQLDDAIIGMLLYEKAWCQRETDRGEAAESTYRELLALGTAGDLAPHAMLELAELEADDKRYEDAARRLRSLEEILEEKPGALPERRRQEAAYRLGVCEFNLGRRAEAAIVLGRLLDEHSESPLAASAGLLCGEALIESGQHEAAARRLERLVAAHPEDENWGPGLLRLAECQGVLGDWKRSGATYRRYLEKFPEAGQWYRAQFGVGWAAENEGRYDDAIAAYTTVAARHKGPTAARAQFQIGECLFTQKRYEDAVRDFLKVDILYAYPEWSAAALYEAGRCFQALSDPVRAREHFERVRAEHPATDWARLAGERLAELSRSSLPGHAEEGRDESGGGGRGEAGR